MLLRIAIIALIGILIVLGVRRIWRDWSGQFKKVDEEENARRRARDLAERKRPDVIELKRDKDGTYRPPSPDDRA